MGETEDTIGLTEGLTEVEIETLRILSERNNIGRKTYGKGLNYQDDYCWLDMAIEEAADMLKYLIAQRMRCRNGAEICQRCNNHR